MNIKSINPDTCCSNCKRYGTTPEKFPIWCSDNDCKCHKPTMNQISNIEKEIRHFCNAFAMTMPLSNEMMQATRTLRAQLPSFIHQQLQKARVEERERLYKEFEKETDGWKSPVPMETAKGILTNWSEYEVVDHSELDQDTERLTAQCSQCGATDKKGEMYHSDTFPVTWKCKACILGKQLPT